MVNQMKDKTFPITSPGQISGCGCLPCSATGFYCGECQDGKVCEIKPDQVEACREWLRLHASKPLSYFPKNGRRIGSYGYKHDVESWTATRGNRMYIANGAFILAAFREGFWVKATGINAVFNFSVKDDRELRMI